MKARPILFSGAMVRALLSGAKTQTRRLYKVRKHPDAMCEMAASELVRERQDVIDRICPYGQPGDRLYVRETFGYNPDHPGILAHCCYRADPEHEHDGIKWIPSIHMPRAASRILLEIVAVRVERLNDCSEADAISEGAVHIRSKSWDREYFPVWRYQFDEAVANGCKPPIGPSPAQAYQALWESINGAGSWNANPWVWVVEFKREPA
jgi:hypothetical protein